MTDTPWEPPLAGTEAEHLIGSIERMRATFRWKADGLDASGLAATIPSSTLSLGGLLKHLGSVEATHVFWKTFGEAPGEPWQSADWSDPDWTFRLDADDTPARLYTLYDDAVARSRERLATALADGGLDQPTQAVDEGRHASLRRLLFDLLEEYGRHTGHADLLREAVDGRTGEDPPPGWTPISGGDA